MAAASALLRRAGIIAAMGEPHSHHSLWKQRLGAMPDEVWRRAARTVCAI